MKERSGSYERFDDRYPELFNSYYKKASAHWLQAERGLLSRPTVAEVIEYRKNIDQKISLLISDGSLSAELSDVLSIGLEHEMQHQELLLMDIKAILAVNRVPAVYSGEPLPSPRSAPDRWFEIPEGVQEVGVGGSGSQYDGFTYDNESPRHKVYQQPAKIKDRLVSNGDYLEFIRDGGYRDPGLWLSLGWDWLEGEDAPLPLYWRINDPEAREAYLADPKQLTADVLSEFTLHGEVPLSGDYPLVHVNYFEADAFARWSGKRLPTEAESELFLVSDEGSGSQRQPVDLPLDAADLHPTRLDSKSLAVWWWTQSHYSPYPGYAAYDGVLQEYNGKFMCSQFVLRGGCCATPAPHMRPTYRNYYHPDQRWAFTGIRLAH